LKKRGLREATIENVGKFLRAPDSKVDLKDIEAVGGFTANHSCSEGYKRNLVYAYDWYLGFKGLAWQRPVHRERSKPPETPREEKLNTIISASRVRLPLC
jgi:hypothetical protein